MKTLSYTLLAAVASVFLTCVLLAIRPPVGSGWVSQGGAEIISFVVILALSFLVFWFPSMVIGYLFGRKTFTRSQKHAHYFVTAISALAFVAVLMLVGNVIIHHQ
jgi:sensor histidine kinase YesM